MFDFYKLAFEMNYCTVEQLEEQTKWQVITKEEFKEITGQEYTGEII